MCIKVLFITYSYKWFAKILEDSQIFIEIIFYDYFPFFRLIYYVNLYIRKYEILDFKRLILTF